MSFTGFVPAGFKTNGDKVGAIQVPNGTLAEVGREIYHMRKRRARFGTNYAISGMSGQTFPHEAELAAMSYRSYHPEGS